jgi:hypothetical protein
MGLHKARDAKATRVRAPRNHLSRTITLEWSGLSALRCQRCPVKHRTENPCLIPVLPARKAGPRALPHSSAPQYWQTP